MSASAAATHEKVANISKAKKDEQDGVIHIEAVRESIGELEKLFSKANSAKDALKEAITKVSEKSGIRKPVLQAYVKARCNDRLDEYQTKAEQLALLFTEIETE